jgi:hypothetical protein
MARLRPTTPRQLRGRTRPSPASTTSAMTGTLMSERVKWNCQTPASRAITVTKLSMKPMMTIAVRIDIAAATGLVSMMRASSRFSD